MMQSPIDITGYQMGDAPPLSFSFRRGVTEVSNDGKMLEAEYAPRNRLGFAERTYELASARWHSPAEHRFDGEELPAELHLVHEQTFWRPGGSQLPVSHRRAGPDLGGILSCRSRSRWNCQRRGRRIPRPSTPGYSSRQTWATTSTRDR